MPTLPESQDDTAGAVSAYLNPTQGQPALAARAAMTVAAGANPEFEAELRRASARTGVPLDSARAFPDDVKRQAALADHDFDNLARQFPGTTAFLANPDNARIAHDDVPNLSSLESTIGPITGPKPTFGSYAGGLLQSFTQGAGMAREGIRMQLADLFGHDDIRKDAESKYSRLSLEQRLATPEFDSSTAQGVYSGLTSTVRAVPGLVASIATRSPTPMLAAMGIQTEADAYGKYRSRGATAGEALAGGIGEGATEVATELLPMGFLVKNMGKMGAGTFLTGMLAREIPGEQIATVVQDAIDTAIANPDKTWGDYVKERPDAAYQTLLATITQAGLMEGANIALQRVQGRAQAAQHAGQVGAALEQLNTLAEASKLRERDTGTAQAFFQSLMQEGRDTVWITPQALAESGMLEQVAAALPGVANQLEQSANTGADIRIPLADLMATLASPELAQSIIPHLADEPGGFTQTTANEYLQSGAAQELADEVARTLADKQNDDAFTASREAVTANIQAQLDTAGRFAPTVNQAYASMVGNFYAVQAARMGITPEEMATRYPLQVKAESMPGVKTLEQPARTIEVDGVRRPITNSEGVQLADSFNGQMEFWRWYGTGAVDGEGRPVPQGGVYTSEAGETRPALTFDQATRGSLSFGDDITAQPSVITLLKNADLSTFLHESGHFFLEVLNDMASRPDAPADIADDMAKVLEWFGIKGTPIERQVLTDDLPAVRAGFVRLYRAESPTVKFEDVFDAAGLTEFVRPDGWDGQSWTDQMKVADYYKQSYGRDAVIYYADVPEAAANARKLADGEFVLDPATVPTNPLDAWSGMDLEAKRPHHEAFARGFEAYLFEGRAPTAELSGLFSRFRSWLVNVYKSLTALQVDLSTEVRGVFDRMLASSEAIAQAERDAGFAGMFGTKPDFMTDEEWTAYRALSIDATEGAVRELETRSLKDMQWLANSKAKVLAKMQREANEKRKAIREEVTAEVMAEPVNVARNFFRRGLYPDGSTADMHKLSIASLIEMYGGEGDKFARLDWEPLGYGKYGALAKEGISPDMAAESLGFDSGEALVDALLNEPLAKDKISVLTDQRMLERHGDLIDEAAIDQAVNEAVHSAAHIRFIATEMNALAKASGKPAVLAKAAKAYAEQIVRRTPINQLRPDRFSSAAARAAKAADKAFKAGDIQKAAAQKQAQLINAYATKAALDARKEVEKTLVRFKTITNGSNEKVAKTRDLDMVMATRAILAEYGVGTRGEKAAKYLEAVTAYDPAMAAVLRERIDAATENARPIKEMTIEQLQALRDEVESLWFLAKRSRQMEVDGDLLDRQDIQEALVARLEEIGVPAEAPGEKHAITPGEVALSKLQSLRAALRRVESWAGAKDGDTAMGPFRRFIWNTIKDRADAYRVDKAKYLKAYRALLDTVAPGLSQVKIAAPELGYTFGFDKGGMGKVELLHAILHTGNAGNKKKLLLGRKWATQREDGSLDTSRWDAFVTRMIAEGTLTRADFDFAQGVWDLLEEMKPAAQKAHREAFGRYFDEVTADPFTVTLRDATGAPAKVEYRGGYVPAIADSRIVTDAKTRAIMEEESATLMNALPSTSKGFTKARVEYNRPLLLDLRLLAGHIDKVLLFSHLEQPVRDVRRVLGHSSVAKPLARVDPAAYDGLLIPWLNRTARQQVETQVDGSNGTMRFFSVVRQRAGMAAMFANVSNTAQQITGFSLAALKVKPAHLMRAAADFIRSPKAMAAAVAAASPYMANRMDNEVAAMTGAINDILLNPSVYEKAVGWTQKHTYFMQSAMDNVMGPIIWHGAYNQALETAPAGLADEALQRYARQLADSAVRETQGSTLPEDISRIETGNAFVRLFTQFAGYFNMQANLLGTEFSKVAQDAGLRKGLGRGFYILLFGFLTPAWAAQAIALAFRGGPEDEDKDGEYLDDWLAATFGWGTLRAGTALVPVVGQTINAVANATNKKPYDDRISTGPAISMIESSAKAVGGVYNLAVGEGAGPKVRDVATLVSMTLGLPANAVARPVTYLTDINSGKAEPLGPVDVGRGLVTGASSPASKGR